MNADCIRMGRILCEALPSLFLPQVESEGLSSAAKWLVRQGLSTIRVVPIRTITPTDRPLATCGTGHRLDFQDALEISRFAAFRVGEATPIPLPVYAATRKAHALWGDRTGVKHNPMALAHDHLLAEVWHRLSPSEKARWRYEVSGNEKFEKVPDAALVDGSGEPTIYHEAIGCYSAARILDLAVLADEKHKPLLMW